MQQNIVLYPWYQAFRSLLFWQGIWFLYFQDELSVGGAILLIAIFDVASALFEVPSGYFSDRFGRKQTLVIGLLAMLTGCLLIGTGSGFVIMALGQILLGAGIAFNSGTDSALLYDSLLATDRQDEVAEHEARAWRFNFSALAVSAFLGGILALFAMSATFLLTAVAAMLGLIIVAQFEEPPVADRHSADPSILSRFSILRSYLRHPQLAWLFYLAVAMYVFSHVPFVFGQPFIDQVLQDIGSADWTTAVSGAVTALMMVTSVAAGWFTLRLGTWLGIAGILLLAFGIQIALIAVLMLSAHPVALLFLLLRMVPNALAQPFILAQIQPRIDSANRATYLSLQSLCGRLGLALTLLVGASTVDQQAMLSHAALQWILIPYVALGMVIWLLLWAKRGRVVDDDVPLRFSTKS